MPLTYRADLERDLTPDEVDANFRYLEQLFLAGKPQVPRPPKLTNFQDTAAGGTVDVLVGDVALAYVVYAPPGSGTFVAVPPSGTITVGNVSGEVQVKSLATSAYLESVVNMSPTFTAISAPTVYQATSQSYTTTSNDYLAKFGQAYVGTYVGVTKSSSSGSASTQAAANALALAEATTQAKAAMGQQTFSATKSYTTTASDFATKCGAGTSGTPQTRQSTKGGYATQAAADQAALADATSQAIAAIVCPVALPTYSRTLTQANGIADGMSFTPPGTEELHFDLIQGTSGASIDIAITVAGATSYITLAGEYTTKGYYYLDAAGVRHDSTFPSADNLNITF